jgi:polyphosphate kinase 2
MSTGTLGLLTVSSCPAWPVASRRLPFTCCAYLARMLTDVRDYIDRLQIEGHTIGEDHDDDPVLIDPAGRAVDTWRENYPYDERLPAAEYDEQKYLLQVELLKFQTWQRRTGARHVLLFEGRDAAGKGGTIKRFMEHLNPRNARTVALSKPNDRERHEWYFQRYVAHLPTAAEMVFFDRSWYNRAGVERVMGFASDDEYDQFMDQVPLFEQMLVASGVMVTKLWFSVTRSEQRTRFIIRQVDPVRQWKLSAMDLESLDKWDAYTAAKEEMFRRTDTDVSPWTTIKSNDKKRARLNAMRAFLSKVDYDGKDTDVVAAPDPLIVSRGIETVGD